MRDRNLDWEGCCNVRDLGGLSTIEGRRTRWGAVVRADSLDHLTSAGWSALEAHGIRTIVDLRNDEELRSDAQVRPDGLTTVHVPLDDIADTEFWKCLWDNELDGTPRLHRPFLERRPERCAAAIAAVASAEPGGVAIRCGIGRDRTGIVTLLLLALLEGGFVALFVHKIWIFSLKSRKPLLTTKPTYLAFPAQTLRARVRQLPPAPTPTRQERLSKLLEKLTLTFRFTLEIQHVGLTTPQTGSYSR